MVDVPNPLPCHKQSYARGDGCFPECSVGWFVRDFYDFTTSLMPLSSMCPRLRKASISATCANFCLATRCLIPESAFLRSRQCSCSKATITSRPVTFVSFIYHHPIVCVTCVSTTGSEEHITTNIMYWIYLLAHISADVYCHQQVVVGILKKECTPFFFFKVHPVVLYNWKTVIKLFVSVKQNNILLFNLLATSFGH